MTIMVMSFNLVRVRMCAFMQWSICELVQIGVRIVYCLVDLLINYKQG